MDRTWHTVTLEDPVTGERLETQEKAVDQEAANQQAAEFVRRQGDDLRVVTER